MRISLLTVALSGVLCAVLATAQNPTDPHSNVFLGGAKEKKDKNPTSRNVKGTVTDEKGRPLENALVTLTNEDTHERLTFFTKADGRYNFDFLRFTTNYTLLAQYKEAKSSVKTLSQYDHTPNAVRILEIEAAPAKPEDSAQK